MWGWFEIRVQRYFSQNKLFCHKISITNNIFKICAMPLTDKIKWDE